MVRASCPSLRLRTIRERSTRLIWPFSSDTTTTTVAEGLAAGDSAPAFLELGPGGVLAGLAKRTDKTWNVRSLSEFADLAA